MLPSRSRATNSPIDLSEQAVNALVGLHQMVCEEEVFRCLLEIVTSLTIVCRPAVLLLAMHVFPSQLCYDTPALD